MKKKIIEMLQNGSNYKQITEALGCSKSTVSHHAQKIGLTKKKSEIDWSAVQGHYDKGHSMSECARHFSIAKSTLAKAKKRGDFTTRQWKAQDLQRLLVKGYNGTRYHVRQRLIESGLLKYECSECGLIDWKGKPMPLNLDHINGDKYDYRIENLRFLCPNCHSQTPTFSNRSAKKMAGEGGLEPPTSGSRDRRSTN